MRADTAGRQKFLNSEFRRRPAPSCCQASDWRPPGPVADGRRGHGGGPLASDWKKTGGILV